MFATDCLTHLACLKRLSTIVKTLDFDAVHCAYFGYYRTMRRNIKSYKYTQLTMILYLGISVIWSLTAVGLFTIGSLAIRSITVGSLLAQQQCHDCRNTPQKVGQCF